jgi:spore coat protein U-like protein
MPSLKIPTLMLALGVSFACPSARAATTVSCTVTAGSIAFGIYNPLSTPSNASSGALRIDCSGKGTGSAQVTANLTLSAGLSGSFATRKMFSGASSLNYNIYWSTAYNQIMGDGTGGSFGGSAGPFTVPAGGTNSATGTMYGLIPASQDVAPGSYLDTIVVTVTY